MCLKENKNNIFKINMSHFFLINYTSQGSLTEEVHGGMYVDKKSMHLKRGKNAIKLLPVSSQKSTCSTLTNEI